MDMAPGIPTGSRINAIFLLSGKRDTCAGQYTRLEHALPVPTEAGKSHKYAFRAHDDQQKLGGLVIWIPTEAVFANWAAFGSVLDESRCPTRRSRLRQRLRQALKPANDSAPKND
jgi:hypothetical protein